MPGKRGKNIQRAAICLAKKNTLLVRGAQPGLVPSKSHLVQLFSFNKPRFFKRQFLSAQHVQPWSRRRNEPQEIAPGEPGAIANPHQHNPDLKKRLHSGSERRLFLLPLFFLFFFTRLQFPFHPTRSRVFSQGPELKKNIKKNNNNNVRPAT